MTRRAAVLPTPSELPSRVHSPRRRTRRQRIEAGCLFDSVRPLAETLATRVIGQEAPVEALVCSFGRLLSGLRDPARPMLTALLLGPTGVGKTETARAIAQALFSSDRALIHIHCEEFAQGHEVSKLLGAPPGYVGYNVEPILSQARLDAPYWYATNESGQSPRPDLPLLDAIAAPGGEQPVSVILFDEIEKAHPTVWNALLGILEEGILTLGDTSRTDFRRSIVLMTSNVGGREIAEALGPHRLGFTSSAEAARSGTAAIGDVAVQAARRRFPPEFLNRFDEILSYGSLTRRNLEAIFHKFLDEIHDRAARQAGTPLLLKLSPAATEWIIDAGTDLQLGARPLRRAMERELVDPLSRLIASGQIAGGDVVEVEREAEGLAFFRRRRGDRNIVV